MEGERQCVQRAAGQRLERPPGGNLSFKLAQGARRFVYTLKNNSPTGLQSYAIAETKGDPPPKVLIEP